MAYVERERVLELIANIMQDCKVNHKHRSLNRNIKQMPTADVVEVVRCKDCDVPHNKWLGCPHLNGLIPPPDFYCAKGTPKERGAKKALKEREDR